MVPKSPGAWLALLLSLAATATAGAAPPLPAEHLEVARLPAPSPHWIWIFDEALYNETDARLYLYDGDAHRELGQVDAGYYPAFSLSPDGRTTAVATTYYSRGSHGTRTDVVEYTDNATLALTGEVVLPPHRAQTLPTLYNSGYSADARFLYVTNLTPAASFTVVDVAKGAVVGDVDTDGCVMVIPSAARRVSSLCETGRLLSITLDESGKEAARSVSPPFFSVDKDPIFVQGIPTATGVLFLSFLGDAYGVDLAGAEPKFATPWPLVTGAERGHWRPGGAQVGAYHKRAARLYVPMHPGGPGTHKVGGTEIWVYDAAAHRRSARWRVDAARYGAVLAVQVTQDEHPLLFALTENAALLVMDAATGRLEHVEAKMGQTPWYLINP